MLPRDADKTDGAPLRRYDGAIARFTMPCELLSLQILSAPADAYCICLARAAFVCRAIADADVVYYYANAVTPMLMLLLMMMRCAFADATVFRRC